MHRERRRGASARGAARRGTELSRQEPAKLAVFDIDGTLTETMAVDTECFIATVEDLLGFDVTGLQWTDFPHVTDAAVLAELYHRAVGRGPAPAEADRFVDGFVGRLTAALQRMPERFAPIPGAQEILEHLATRSDWAIALATGGWFRSARFKLDAAGLRAPFPTATSDDHFTREGIFSTAVERATQACGVTSFDRVVSLGDGAWDVRTARTLEVPFVGVGSCERLELIGAHVGVADYLDIEGVVDLLETAPVP